MLVLFTGEVRRRLVLVCEVHVSKYRELQSRTSKELQVDGGDHDVRARSSIRGNEQAAQITDIGQHIIYKTVTSVFSSILISSSQGSKMPAKLTPFKDLRVLRYQIPAHGLTPNTSIQNRPLLIYKSTFNSTVAAGEIEAHLSSVGVVSPQWRYSMYTTSHFHVSRAITSLVPTRLLINM